MNELEKTENIIESEIKPWCRNENEPLETYSLFEIYLTMGPNRSLKSLAANFHQNLKKIYNLSSKWNWNKRAALYDAAKFELDKNEILTEIEARNKRVSQYRAELSSSTEGIYLELLSFLNNSWRQYQNPDVQKKITFIKSLTSTLKSLLKMSEIKLSPLGLNDAANRDIKINNILNLNNDNRQVNIEKTNLYNIYRRLSEQRVLDDSECENITGEIEQEDNE